MSYELLYTSAARGLKPGSQGFCVVVSTQGLATNLADRLESLSGYRHVFPAQDQQAALNPIVWSHLRLSVAGRTYHVLSRIAAAGLDYTQRSNKIAHHVALEQAELAAAGPAALLSAPGFMATEWDGQARLLPHGRPTPVVAAAPAVCRGWQAATGDAGWGGVLAESAAGGTNRPALLIFNPGTDVLGLLAESLALLPADRRWQVTFSSYYTRLPAGVDCQWRGLVAGSPEALAARQVPGALIIDLSRPLGPAQGGPLVTAARTGRVIADITNSPVLAGHGQAHVGRGVATHDPAVVERRTAYPPLADSGIELGGIELGGIELIPPPQADEVYWQPPVTRTPTPKSAPRWPLWLAAAVAVLVGVSLGLALWIRFKPDAAVALRQNDTRPATPGGGSPAAVTPEKHRPADPPPKKQERPNPAARIAPIKTEPIDSSPDPDDSDSPDDTSPPELSPFDSDSMPPKAPPAKQPPRGTLDSLPSFVELPPIGGEQPGQTLFSLPAADDYSLKLVGPPMADGTQLVLKRDGGDGFSILVETSSAVGGSERIARLEARDGALDFRWEPLKNGGQRARWRELRNQLLRIHVEDLGDRLVALRRPEHAAPLQLALTGKPAESVWELDAPPAGDYAVAIGTNDRLDISSHGRFLSVNLRSQPISTPVNMTVEVSPPKVFGKHMLQSKLKGTVRLTYRGVQIAREHLKADDPQAFEPTNEPEPITPEALRGYMSSLGEQIKTADDKLKSLGPPPASPPPGKAPPPGAPPPPTDEHAEERRQLIQSLRRDKDHLRQAGALNQLFAVLQSTRFEYRLFCDTGGHPVCVVSTSEPASPLVRSASGP